MFGRSVLIALGFLAFVAANSAGAQGSLDRGKTGAQLFASACATCHKSPQSASKTKYLFGLESFLREHYTSSRESAAILAGYLKGPKKLSPADAERGHVAGHITEAKPAEPTLSNFGADIPRPPADIPDVKR